MAQDMTRGGVMRSMLLFSLPMIAGNLIQQLYNVADTLIVGKFLGTGALAAVGSSYTLMVFLTSVNLGFCMGSGVVFSRLYGARKPEDMKISICNAFGFIGLMTLLINLLAFLCLNPLLTLLNIQPQVLGETKTYLQVVLWGMMFTFVYNFFAAVLRSIGNSLMPLVFLAIAALTNIVLDIIFVVPLGWGVAGAAAATVIAQGLSAVLVTLYFVLRAPQVRPGRSHMRFSGPHLTGVVSNSVLSSVQQSIMNFGILMIQGLVNSFGVAVTAAFAVVVKIDSFAYMPVQDFGNAFSTFVAQNHGAQSWDRIRSGIRGALWVSMSFGAVVSLAVVVFARPLMLIFLQPDQVEVLAIGVTYLRIEGVFYCLIACLFLLYGLYRGLSMPWMSVVLTVISLGTRVALAYLLAPIPAIGLVGIWWAIPIGWLLADVTGLGYYALRRKRLLAEQ